jgi:hypothetical protein
MNAPGKANYEFSLYLNVYDPAQLFKAALASAIEDGMDASVLVGADDDIDIRACLIQLLDPGSLPGCDIYNSTAEGD